MVRIDSYSGNFNYLNSKDRSTIVRIYLPEDAPENVLDESWAEGDEPDTDLPPSEMVELFSKRLAEPTEGAADRLVPCKRLTPRP